MGDNDTATLERKINKLIVYLKDLSKEVKQQKDDSIEINKEIENVKDKINNLTQQVHLLEGGYKPAKTYKDFSDEEIYQLRQKTSIAKLAAALKCSSSTINNRINRYKRERGLI